MPERSVQISGESDSGNVSLNLYRRRSIVTDIHGIRYEEEDDEGRPILHINESTEVAEPTWNASVFLLLNTYKDKEHHLHIKGSSWYASVFLTVNAVLGAGILNIPRAFADAGGYSISMIIHAVLVAFIFWTPLILAYCSNFERSATLQDMLYSLCGRWAQCFCSIAIILFDYGTCCTFLIIIGDQSESLFYEIYLKNPLQYCENKSAYRTVSIIVTSCFFILPLCFAKRIDFLKYVSAGGVIALLYVVCLVANSANISKKDENKEVSSGGTDILAVIPVICYSYMFHDSAIPIYFCLKNRSLKEYKKTIYVAIPFCFLCYSLVGVCGYERFKSAVAHDILQSYYPEASLEKGFVLTAIIMIVLKTFTSYPIYLFCGRAACESLWYSFRKHSPHQEVKQGERKRRYVVTLIWFSTSLISVFIPNLSIVIKILGGLAAVFIFVFPGLCLLQVGRIHVQTKCKRNLVICLSAFYIIIGISIFFLGLVLTLEGLPVTNIGDRCNNTINNINSTSTSISTSTSSYRLINEFPVREGGE